MKGFKVIKPGPLTTLQDLGRFGYQSIGLTTGGCMDEHAARWANRLLDNPPDTPLLEVTLGNMQLQVEIDTWIAVTGADMALRINGEAQAHWQTHFVQAGDTLTLGWASSGVRGYLAVSGGFVVPQQFGSCATVVREQVGGLNGKALQTDDQLSFSLSRSDRFSCPRQVPPAFIPDYQAPLHAAVIMGYQQDSFDKESRARFFSSSYRVSQNSDRMGYRLEGSPLHSDVAGLLSEGISYGAIQVPADGQPIILLKDRQTLGGYPKIGTLLPVDAFRLSQLGAGQEVSFYPIDLAAAQQKMRAFYRFFS